MTPEARAELRRRIDATVRARIKKARHRMGNTHCENCDGEIPEINDGKPRAPRRFCSPACAKRFHHRNNEPKTTAARSPLVEVGATGGRQE